MLTNTLRRLALGCVASAASAALTMTAAHAEPRVLRAISPWAPAYYWTEPLLEFERRVNEKMGDKVKVEYIGHADIVPTFEQFEALHNGVVDVILGASSYYTGQVPEATAVLYTQLQPSELRANGFFDRMQKVHREKGDVVYLANVGGGVGKAFRMYLNKKIDKPDFTGLKIRVSPVYVDLVKALGGTPVVMNPGEIYTALERGVVDGFGWSYGGISDFGWHEVTKYAIDHGFYSANTAILINGEVWDSLDAETQAELAEIGREVELWAQDYMDAQNEADNELLKEAGVEFITFSEDDRKAYIATAYDAAWKSFIAEHPEIGPQLRALAENK